MTTICPTPESATLNHSTADALSTAGIDDAHRVAWGPRPAEYVSRQDLLGYAQRQIAHLMDLPQGWDEDGGVPVTSRSAKRALMFLNALIFKDNLATPQVSPQGRGGLDIEWLVSGNHLSVSVTGEGHVVMWAMNADDVEMFSIDSTDGMPDRNAFLAVMNGARQFLYEISMGVHKRVALR